MKYVVILLIVLGIFFAVHTAEACSQVMPQVSIQTDTILDTTEPPFCADSQCVYSVIKDTLSAYPRLCTTADTSYCIGGITAKEIQLYPYTLENADHEAVLGAIHQLSRQPTDEVERVFFSELANNRNLKFAPYTTQEFDRATQTQNKLLNCTYTDTKQYGSWMRTTSAQREYCSYQGGGGGMCPVLVLSYPQFIGYIFSNFTGPALPYALGCIVLILFALAFLVYLIIKKELGMFLKPSKVGILSFMGISILLFLIQIIAYRDFLGMLIQLIVVYLLICLITYIIRKKKSRKPPVPPT